MQQNLTSLLKAVFARGSCVLRRMWAGIHANCDGEHQGVAGADRLDRAGACHNRNALSFYLGCSPDMSPTESACDDCHFASFAVHLDKSSLPSEKCCETAVVSYLILSYLTVSLLRFVLCVIVFRVALTLCGPALTRFAVVRSARLSLRGPRRAAGVVFRGRFRSRKVNPLAISRLVS